MKFKNIFIFNIFNIKNIILIIIKKLIIKIKIFYKYYIIIISLVYLFLNYYLLIIL